MLNLVRSGPRQLILESSDLVATLDAIKGHYANIMMIKNEKINYKEKFHKLTQLAEEKKVFIHLTDHIKSVMSIDDFAYSILLDVEIDEALINIVNNFEQFKITKTRLTPKLIVMKSIGDFDLFFNAVNTDINGVLENRDNMFDNYSTGTFIAFSNTSINYPVAFSDLNDKLIYTEDEYSEVIKILRTRNLKYLNAGVKNQDWHELKIKIYDAYGHYDLHYNRLMYVLDKLDYGLVLGESWGTDAATVFWSVGVYKVRLFTFLDPQEIKKLLIALEFLEDGTRVVDYDLYQKRKKIHWDSLRTKELVDRLDISSHYRNELLSKLSDKERTELMIMENDIRLSKTWSKLK